MMGEHYIKQTDLLAEILRTATMQILQADLLSTVTPFRNIQQKIPTMIQISKQNLLERSPYWNPVDPKAGWT